KSTVCCIESVENNPVRADGTHLIHYVPTTSGDFSLIVQAVEAGGLLAEMWDNAFFNGEPMSSE
ncbi:unnamed protein product, partial [Amoebophrya sp. A25]